MIHKVKLFIPLMCIMILLTACGFNSRKPVERQGFHMGTVITQRVYGRSAGKAADKVMKKIQEIESMMTINNEGGEVNRLNEASGRESVQLSPETFQVLESAKRYAELSEGAFDVTVGPLVKAWGIFTANPRVPAQDEINGLLKLVGYKDILLDKDNLRAALAKEGQIADLGGIAKGYAGDAAIQIFKENGIKSAFVNLGGNVVLLGGKPDGSPWSIGVQNPRGESGKYLGILKLKDKAVVSSGDYERFFERDGVRYHHILDPKTGYPSETELMGTTIVADKSIDADALSTTVFVLGLERGMKLIESLSGVDAVFITKDKKIYVSQGLQDVFYFDEESKEYEYVKKR